MLVPEVTSADEFDSYIPGKRIATAQGPAWRELRAAVYSAPAKGTTTSPGLSEPLLQWTISGEVEVEDREGDGAWSRTLIKKDSFFLTGSTGPYDCRWRALSGEPFEYMMVTIAVPVLQEAYEEVFGAEADHVQLQDFCGFSDETLSLLMRQVYRELQSPKASALAVKSLAQLIAVHLARNYAEVVSHSAHSLSSLPGYKLRQVTDWIDQHFDQDFDLGRLATLAGLSEFYFHRLFKSAMGMTPYAYQTEVRMKQARRLLRETRHSISAVALDVGYANPSHFANVFRRVVGLSPSEYRRQR
ncbi:MAG: AraC family transcriptional regulator [Verrucomicrobiota bacterium JB022]|nr:AraC family transcriptional regulator [Verrucomicrobiota bacterium JB022]